MTARLRGFLARPLATSLGVFLIAVVSHLTIVGNGFVYDDPLEIESNPIMEAPFSLRAIFSAEYMSGVQGRASTGHYRPLTLLVQKLEYDLFGLNPLPFHLTVLLLHAALATLIVTFLRRRCGLRAGAFLAASLFAVHPVLTEAAVCSYSLKEVLAAFLAFSALWLYSGWDPARPLARGVRVAGAALLLAAALFSKESTLTFFLVLPAWDLLRRGRTPAPAMRTEFSPPTPGLERPESHAPQHDPQKDLGHVLSHDRVHDRARAARSGVRSAPVPPHAKGGASRPGRADAGPWPAPLPREGTIRAAALHGLLFFAAVFGAMTFRAPVIGRLFRIPTGSPINNPLLEEGDLGVRLATALRLAWRYLRLLLAPVGLSHDYSVTTIPLARTFLAPDVLAGAAILAGLLVLVLRAPRLQAPAGLGAVITVLSYGLVSNLVLNFGTLFSERFLYLPSVGLALVVAPYLEALVERVRGARRPLSMGRFSGRILSAAALALPVALLTLFAVMTLARTRVFRDDDTLLLDSYRHAPGNVALQASMAGYHRRMGDFQMARALVEDIERTRPDMPFLIEQKAVQALAEHKREEGLKGLAQAIRRPEADISTFRMYAEQLADAGREEDAIRVLSEGFLNPQGDYRERARARELRGALLLRAGKSAQALVDLRLACNIFPELAAAWGDLARALLGAGASGEARLAYERAVALAPRNKAFLENLARLEAKSRDFPAASAHYRTILALDPADLSARTSLAGCLLGSGDLEGARALFEEVLRAAPDERHALASLASLDAAHGNTPVARARYERFLSRPQPEDDLTRQVRERLAALPP